MKNRPERVQKARVEGDTRYLQAAGRKSAKVVAGNRNAALMMRERIQEQRADEETVRAENANEHIIPLETYD